MRTSRVFAETVTIITIVLQDELFTAVIWKCVAEISIYRENHDVAVLLDYIVNTL